MNKVLLAAMLTLIFTMGCGSDPVTPQQTEDLTGIVGTWDIQWSPVYITLPGNDGRVCVMFSRATVLEISLTEVTEDGAVLDFTYDGSILTLTGASVTANVYYPDCGQINFEWDGEYSVLLEPGDVGGQILGVGNYNVDSENCYELFGPMLLSGNLIKR